MNERVCLSPTPREGVGWAVLFVMLTGIILLPQAAAGEVEELIAASSNPFNFIAGLNDRRAGGALEIPFTLTLPDSASAQTMVPAIVFVHGASGPRPHHRRWLRQFRRWGFATAVADHFKPRGRTSAVGSHIELTGAAMTADAFAMLRRLAAHPRVDGLRVAIMGSSKGGGVALYSAWERLRAHYAGELRFAAHIALYPTCVEWEVPDATPVPVVLLVGDRDNWTGHADCARSVERFRRSGFTNVSIRLYEGAPHGFDSGKAVREIPNAYNVVGCRFTIDAMGRDLADGVYMEDSRAKRAALQNCIGRGVRYGGHDPAFRTALEDVRRIVIPLANP